MANDLNLPTIADGQADQQFQTSNDADAALGDALAEIYTADFSGGNVTLTAAQFRSAMTFVPSGLSTTRNLIIPSVKRALFFVNNTDAADTINVVHGSTSIAVTFGKVGVFSTDGTTDNLTGVILATGSSSVPLASTTEVLTGTDTAKAVTSDALAALWEKGSDVASATTLSLGEGGYFHVTGTTTITDIDWATAKDGRAAVLVFDGILTLTHNSTTLKLPTGASITTAAGDRGIFVQDATDNVVCVVYQRADGTPLAGGGFTAASTTEALTGTDTSKGVTPDALAALWEKGSDVASSGTISIGEGGYCHVTGTTTITDIDWATAKDGRTAWAIFDGILTLTHHATTLKLPSAANITTAAGDRALFVQDATDNVICLAYVRADGTPLVSGSVTGKQTIWVPAAAMSPATTNGPATGQIESTTNKVNIPVLDFDATTAEQAWFNVAFPKGWNEGTVTFQVFWCGTATDTDGIAMSLAGISFADNETLDTAAGTPVVVTDDAQSNSTELYVSAESSAVTIAGTPAVDELVAFRVQRVVSDGNDDMSEDMRLIGIKLFYTTDAANDA